MAADLIIKRRKYRNEKAIIDNNLYDELSKHDWHIDKDGYVKSHKLGLMHRYIVKPGKGKIIDHINHDILDNRRDNLRICTTAENIRNSRPQKDKTSKYKGVYWCNVKRKWHARIMYDRKNIHLKYLNSEENAAIVYNIAALKYFGEFANFNEGAK